MPEVRWLELEVIERSTLLRSGFGALAAASLAACASTQEPVIGTVASQPSAELGQAGYSQARPTTYFMRPSDRISISVFREPDFSMESVQIGVEGDVSIPLIGPIRAAGLTTRDFELDVAMRLASAGLIDPRVSVNIDQYASNLVTVDGAVTQPGVYPFQPGARLSSAIAQARGPSRTADAQQVAVFRETPDGIAVALFDFQQVSQGTMLDPILEPGDRVVIGTDGLSVFWQDFLLALPALGIFANPNNF